MADLPEPYDYCYEWDGPYGTRKFSAASHNGRRPDKSVPLFTADQLRVYAAAKVAEERAKWVAEAAAFEQTMSRLSQTIDRISANVDSAIRGTEAASRGET